MKKWIFKTWRRIAAAPAPLLGLVLLVSALAAGCAAEKLTLDTARPAAARGDARALYFLAKHYARGEDGLRNAERAADYMRQAAERGYAAAQNDFGAYCLEGWGVKADPVEAARWFRKAAEHGDPLAEYSLGLCYAQGRGVSKDIVESLKWYRKAAGQNQPDAAAALGSLYLFGSEGFKVDYAAAFKWYQKGEQHGSAVCGNDLGFMYERGLGVTKNPDKAMHCYRDAAEKGFSRAYASLGRLYLDGFQLKQDLVVAYKWFIVGADQGDGVARHYLQEMDLKQLLSPGQKAEAQRLAREYQDSRPKPVPPR